MVFCAWQLHKQGVVNGVTDAVVIYKIAFKHGGYLITNKFLLCMI